MCSSRSVHLFQLFINNCCFKLGDNKLKLYGPDDAFVRSRSVDRIIKYIKGKRSFLCADKVQPKAKCKITTKV